MEDRKAARTWVVFAVLFAVSVHGGAARPLRSGCDRMQKGQTELLALAPDVAAAGPTGTGEDGIGDQKNFLPIGGVGVGAGIGGYAGVGGYLGRVMPTLGGVGGVGSGFGMGGGFGAGGAVGVGGIGGVGAGPGGLGGLGGLGVGPRGSGVPLPFP